MIETHLGASVTVHRVALMRSVRKEMIMQRTVKCYKGKKSGKLFLASRNKRGELVFVNLVKGNKRYTPDIEEGREYTIEFASYKLDEDGKRVALFDVEGI